MNLQKIGKLIAKIRKEKELTQDELADKFGISGKSVSKWERGINAPDISLLQALSEELGISVNELLSGERNEIKNNDKDTDRITIDSIHYYTDNLKHKNLFLMIIIVLSLLFTFLLVFTINNFNKCLVYSISSDDKMLEVSGYLIFNQQEKILILNDIYYNYKNTGTNNKINAKNISLRFVSGNKTIFHFFNEDINKFNDLATYLKSISLNYTDRNNDSQNIITKDDLDELYMIIEYVDELESDNKIKFKIKFNQEFSNNKLFY